MDSYIPLSTGPDGTGRDGTGARASADQPARRRRTRTALVGGVAGLAMAAGGVGATLAAGGAGASTATRGYSVAQVTSSTTTSSSSTAKAATGSGTSSSSATGCMGMGGTMPTAVGTVQSVDTATNSFVLKEANATTVTVDVSSTTTYRDRAVSSPGLSNVTVGEQVAVAGKLSSGTVSATAVTIGAPDGPGFGGPDLGDGVGSTGSASTSGIASA